MAQRQDTRTPEHPAQGHPGTLARRRNRIVLIAAVVAIAVVVAVALATADTDGDGVTSTASPRGSPSSSASSTVDVDPTSTAAPGPSATTTAPPSTSTPTTPAGGEPGPGCVDGWTTPAAGTVERRVPLDLIRRDMGIEGRFVVVEMRHFTGPEVPWIIAPRPEVVEWWYVKAHLADDPSFAARWLVARRSENVHGLAAVARFATTGYRSPDWRAFLGDGEPRPVAGLPGSWVGMEFDFVVGEDGEKPGLPVENVACLDGT